MNWKNVKVFFFSAHIYKYMGRKPNILLRSHLISVWIVVGYTALQDFVTKHPL
jgi:hypothetical protein